MTLACLRLGAAAHGSVAGAKVTLQTCNFTDLNQKWKNDYTRVRNAEEPFALQSHTGWPVEPPPLPLLCISSTKIKIRTLCI